MISTLKRDELEPVLDHCGVVAIFSPKDTACFLPALAGIKKLQTRGYDGAGIAFITEDGRLTRHVGEGPIESVFTTEIQQKLQLVEARTCLVQTRYATKGVIRENNLQPFVAIHENSKEFFGVIHNGQFSSTPNQPDEGKSDTLIFTEKLAETATDDLDTAIVETLATSSGAWSLIIGTSNALYLSRDPYGIRPLAYGCLIDQATKKKTWLAASETNALVAMGVTFFYEVMPGSVLKITSGRVKELKPISKLKQKKCALEAIYFKEGESKHDSIVKEPTAINDSMSVKEVRQRCGAIMAREAPPATDIDLVIGIPGTGIAGGQAYAKELDLPYAQAITDKEENSPRTFIYQDVDAIYDKVLNNFDFDEQQIRGKSVLIVDDSIVRGNVSRALVWILKNVCGATEVHVRSLSPIIDKGCFLGINTKDDQLIGARHHGDVRAICTEIHADSLAYISDAGLIAAFGDDDNVCLGCMFNNQPPIDRYGNPNTTQDTSVTNDPAIISLTLSTLLLLLGV